MLPLLSTSIQQYWPDIPARSVLAAQVEQESGWRAAATLRTSREIGAGLGQFTRAYRADGSVRFDAVAELASAHPELRGWSWANAYDPHYQLAAVVLKNRTSYRAIGWAASPEDRMAMMDAAYNSGLGSVIKRRAKCNAIPGCIPGRWFGHLERSSTQSKSRVAGYGQSFADITNTHVRNVMVVRRPKYKIYFKE
ncbi:lytic murein transglycosylase [Aquitalea aquatilis]|uniref:lytic murein transglycosylase n=1 Tax=Aquitalea aquatilis TaxID=1537400 RepID=UPI0010BDF8CD|nr:lytic murein transglycosylase [Aquitalea aquatilis]